MMRGGASTSEKASRGLQSRGFLTGAGICVVLAAWVLQDISYRSDGSAIALSGRLNPNTASVSSLARLPGVGMARASAIVAYRARPGAETGQGAVFRCAEDLEHIKGIGPKTAREIGPWLDFDPIR